MHKSKRKTQPERFPLKISALILIVIAIAVFKGLQDFQLDPDTAPIQLDLPAATVSETDDIQLMDIPEIDEPILDVAFSEDSSSWYALGTNRLYKMELNGTESQPVASVSFPSEYEANTLAVYPGANQIAIGAMRTNDDATVTPAIIFVDLPGLQFIDYELASENQNNRGYSINLAFTPDGSQLYHLYTLNDLSTAGCGNPIYNLDVWDMNTHQAEVFELPEDFASDFAISDGMLAVQLHTECPPSIDNTSRLAFYSDDSIQVSVPSARTPGYQDLTFSVDSTLFVATLQYPFPTPIFLIHIWNQDAEIMYEFELNQNPSSIAISPDNQYAVMYAAMDSQDVHFINLRTGNVDYSLETGDIQGTVHNMYFSPDGHYLVLNKGIEQIMWYLP